MGASVGIFLTVVQFGLSIVVFAVERTPIPDATFTAYIAISFVASIVFFSIYVVSIVTTSQTLLLFRIRRFACPTFVACSLAACTFGGLVFSQMSAESTARYVIVTAFIFLFGCLVVCNTLLCTFKWKYTGGGGTLKTEKQHAQTPPAVSAPSNVTQGNTPQTNSAPPRTSRTSAFLKNT